jgi:hypothetical protein
MNLKRNIPGFALAAALIACMAMPAFAFGQQQQNNKNNAREQHRDQKANKPRAGEWLRKYRDVPPQQQQQALQNDPQFKMLPQQRQQQLQQRLQNFNAMPPQQQDRVLDRMQKFDSMNDQQKRRSCTSRCMTSRRTAVRLCAPPSSTCSRCRPRTASA